MAAEPQSGSSSKRISARLGVCAALAKQFELSGQCSDTPTRLGTREVSSVRVAWLQQLRQFVDVGQYQRVAWCDLYVRWAYRPRRWWWWWWRIDGLAKDRRRIVVEKLRPSPRFGNLFFSNILSHPAARCGFHTSAASG